jgi:hypothetical protein
VICGTRGDPGTVAPFRAWRGSRDLVAQSPKFHAPAAANVLRGRKEKSSTAYRAQLERSARSRFVSLFELLFSLETGQDFGFAVAAGASGGCTSDGFTQFTLNGPAPWTCTIVSPLQVAK